jgi:hypothetical protein
MKQGTVIYLTGASDLPEGFDEEREMKKLALDPHWTLLAASTNGFHDIHTATKVLMERGATNVHAVKAQVGDDGRMELFGETLRVFG